MKKSIKKNWLGITIILAGIILVFLISIMGNKETKIDASFDFKNMEKENGNFVMSIGEETQIEWSVEPVVKGTKIKIPRGLEHLGGELEYSGGMQKINVRAVRVGKWEIVVENNEADFVGEKTFVCIGITKEDAIKKCE